MSRGMARTPGTLRLLSDACSSTLGGSPIPFCMRSNLEPLGVKLILVPSLQQDYPECMREQLGDRLPALSASDFTILRAADCDFYGMNYYTSQFARHRDEPPSDTDFKGNVDELFENKQGEVVGELSGIEWLRSCPELFRKHLTRVYRLYGKPVYITENGCPCPGEDRMTKEESVEDPFRIKYFEDHLDAIGRSVSEDESVVAGYFAWSLLDNLGKSTNRVEG